MCTAEARGPIPLLLPGGDVPSDFGTSAASSSDPGIAVGAYFQRSDRLHSLGDRRFVA